MDKYGLLYIPHILHMAFKKQGFLFCSHLLTLPQIYWQILMGKGLLICCHSLTIKPIKKHALTFCCSPVFSRDAPVAVFLASKLTAYTNIYFYSMQQYYFRFFLKKKKKVLNLIILPKLQQVIVSRTGNRVLLDSITLLQSWCKACLHQLLGIFYLIEQKQVQQIYITQEMLVNLYHFDGHL